MIWNCWIFRRRKNANGFIKFKAWLVIKGYNPPAGEDYGETRAPVAKFATLKMLVAIDASYDWYIHQMNVVTAFSNPSLNEKVYMEQPEGFEIPFKNKQEENHDFFCQLKKLCMVLNKPQKLGMIIFKIICCSVHTATLWPIQIFILKLTLIFYCWLTTF